MVDATLHTPHGSWQIQHPNPDPYYRDDILWADWHADPAALHARFPDRALYTLEVYPDGPDLRKLDPRALPPPNTSPADQPLKPRR